MSDGQRRMWFVQSVDPDSALLNICVSYRVTGNVDVARLRQAVEAVAVRHPILRTTYQTDGDGNPYPVIRDDLRPGWAEHDLSGLAEQARRLRLEVLAQRQFRAAVRPDQGFAAAGRGRAGGRRRADAAAHRAPHRLGRRFVGAVLHRPHPRLRRRHGTAAPLNIVDRPGPTAVTKIWPIGVR